MPSGVAAGQPQLPPVAKLMIVLIPFLMMGFVFVLLPIAWVLFYRSRHVQATCEARDPVARWTDACPLPVLALRVCLKKGVYRN